MNLKDTPLHIVVHNLHLRPTPPPSLPLKRGPENSKYSGGEIECVCVCVRERERERERKKELHQGERVAKRRETSMFFPAKDILHFFL